MTFFHSYMMILIPNSWKPNQSNEQEVWGKKKKTFFPSLNPFLFHLQSLSHPLSSSLSRSHSISYTQSLLRFSLSAEWVIWALQMLYCMLKVLDFCVCVWCVSHHTSSACLGSSPLYLLYLASSYHQHHILCVQPILETFLFPSIILDPSLIQNQILPKPSPLV